MSISSLPNITSKAISSTKPVETSKNNFFNQIKDALKSESLNFEAIEKSLSNPNSVNTQTLLLYQIQVNKLGLRTELFSKIGEALLATTRKLQSTGQA